MMPALNNLCLLLMPDVQLSILSFIGFFSGLCIPLPKRLGKFGYSADIPYLCHMK